MLILQSVIKLALQFCKFALNSRYFTIYRETWWNENVSTESLVISRMYFCLYLAYEITIATSDKQDGGMMHNAWVRLEGDKKKSREFLMKNSPVHKVFRKGNRDSFMMEGKYLGKLKGVTLGATQREDKPLGT